jgi:hypothetical protein
MSALAKINVFSIDIDERIDVSQAVGAVPFSALP